MYNIYELAIIAFILIGIGVVIWRGGQANPESTGSLQTKLKNVSFEVGQLADRFGQMERSAASGEDIALMRERLEAEIRRTDKFFASLEILSADIHALREQQAAKNVVIESLSESLRAIAQQLSDHRDDVNRRLDAMDAMAERIDANRRAIEAIGGQLPAIRDKQDQLAEALSATSSDVKIIGRQVDRLYDVIVNKGLN